MDGTIGTIVKTIANGPFAGLQIIDYNSDKGLGLRAGKPIERGETICLYPMDVLSRLGSGKDAALENSLMLSTYAINHGTNKEDAFKDARLVNYHSIPGIFDGVEYHAYPINVLERHKYDGRKPGQEDALPQSDFFLGHLVNDAFFLQRRDQVNEYFDAVNAQVNVGVDPTILEKNGQYFIEMFATRKIAAGEDLLFNYGLGFWIPGITDQEISELFKKWVRSRLDRGFDIAKKPVWWEGTPEEYTSISTQAIVSKSVEDVAKSMMFSAVHETEYDSDGEPVVDFAGFGGFQGFGTQSGTFGTQSGTFGTQSGTFGTPAKRPKDGGNV